MRITPLDIRQKQFSLKFRGFDINEVDQFLELLGEDLETLIRENNTLKDELMRQEAQLQEFRDTERALKNTMVSAQQIVEDMKANSAKEADLLLKEAERRGDALIRKAQQKASAIEDEINELKRRKWEFIERMRGFMHTFERMIEEEERTEGKWNIRREGQAQPRQQARSLEFEEEPSGFVVEEVQEVLPMEGTDSDRAFSS